MMRLLAVVALGVVVTGCDPVTAGLALKLMDEVNKETDNFELVNQTDTFYRKADHHDYHETEVYTWHNCGEQALVDVEVTPSCPNDIYISLYDAEGTAVLVTKLCAPDCFHGKKDWDPIPTAVGVPGLWRLEFTFDLEGVNDLEILITRMGPSLVEVTGTAIIAEGSGATPKSGDPDGGGGTPPPPPPDPDPKVCEPSFLSWKSVCTDDRTVEESYPLPVDCEETTVTLAWESIAQGTMEIIVLDAAGNVVYQTLLDPTTPLPPATQTAVGSPGTWTVTLLSTELTSTGLEVRVENP